MPVNQSIYQSDQGTSPFAKIYRTVCSILLVLLALLQLQDGGKDTSPFETHGLIMMLFIVTMLNCALVAMGAIIVQAWLPKHASLVPVINQICIGFGILACDLLLLVLAPPIGYFFLVIWILALVLLLSYVFTLIYAQELHNKIKSYWNDLLLHAAPQASATSPMALAQAQTTAVEQQV